MNRTPLLFLNVLIIATCGLVYELVAGALASYVLGDSVTQFSVCIGVYLFAMGVGAWLSKFIDRGLARAFVEVELAVALLGGFSAPLLFLSFAHLSFFHVVLYGTVFGIGVLVGLELPLLMRILQSHLEFKDLVARVLTFDYVGALAASLLFPIFLVPSLGLVRTSLLFGILNGAVGLWGTYLLQPMIDGGLVFVRARAVFVLTLLAVAMIKADWFTTWAEDRIYTHPVVYAETSPYQRIVLTRGAGSFELYLDGNLQFSSRDEYRYHEALVHPAMLAAKTPRRVLVLGGGDGLAVREILRYDEVESITLVDLDPAMTDLSENFPPLAELNGHALEDSRVKIINQDAMIWLETVQEQFDAAIVDFPDPNDYALGKLYTRRFYRLLAARLADEGAVTVQCTSPFLSRASYWCIVRTLESAGFTAKPYHASVPVFGVWGFVVARKQPFAPPQGVPPGLRYLNDETLAAMFHFPADLAPVPTEINRLDNQALVHYYEHDLGRPD
jgi:spermidine synthase